MRDGGGSMNHFCVHHYKARKKSIYTYICLRIKPTQFSSGTHKRSLLSMSISKIVNKCPFNLVPIYSICIKTRRYSTLNQHKFSAEEDNIVRV